MKTWINKISWIAIASTLITAPAYALKPADEAIIELYQRVEDLQHDINSLRGKNEQLTHELNSIRKDQKEGFIGVDDQIKTLEEKLQSSANTEPSVSDEKDKSVDNEAEDDNSATTTDKPDTASTEQDPRKVKDTVAYKRAYELLKDDPSAAISDFTDFLVDYPSSRLAANAHYWIGETWYSKGDYEKAKQHFLTILKNYKGSSKESDAALKLGYSFIALKDWDFAKKTLQDVIKFFPDTREAELAKTKLDTIKDK